MSFEFLRARRAGVPKWVGAVAIAGFVLGSGAAAADYRTDGWGRNWGATVNSYNPPQDRSLTRQWETQPARGLPTLLKSNIAPLRAAIERYAAVVAAGGWERLPMMKLRAGVRHPAVIVLRERLLLTGDMIPGRANSTRFGYYLTEAVKRFQARHGLPPTGVVDRSTILALNVSAEARLKQLRTNLARLRRLSGSAAKKYVVVNIPAAQIEAVEDDEVVSRHAAVVGKVDRPTPVLRSRIQQVNFNPYWNIPQSIVRKDLVPKARLYARRGKDILSEYRIDAYSGSGKVDPRKIDWFSPSVYNYSYRQRPWEDNSMGFVKISFPNAHAVYLHDTPSRSLFARNFRAYSSGCVRVQNVEQLVAWLLAGNEGWDLGRVRQMQQTGARQDVTLKRKVPVYLVYITAWATRDGTVNFRRDIYGRDHVGETASAY